MNRNQRSALRFRTTHHHEHRDLYSRLASGQQPHTMMICCSDSRIMPPWLTDSGPGDLFVLRNAGNIIPPTGTTGERATVTYAAAALGIEELIVCGHSGCGAMGALRDPQPGTPSVVQGWVEQARPALDRLEAQHDDVPIDALIEENVRLQLENLTTIPNVRTNLEDGTLRLVGWVYDIGSGVVRELNPTTGSFEPLRASQNESLAS